MSWTDERVDLLQRLWAEGHSASQIAKQLGGVTRNAVIGKVHRLGLSNRAAPRDASGQEAAPPEEVPAQPEAPAAEDAAPAAAGAGAPRAGAAQGADAAALPREAPAAAAPAQPAAGVVPFRRPPVMVPGQPLPPQPSQNEISPEALATVREVEKRARRLSLMELTERTCKWPVGDPATEDFWFCGLPSVPGKPYCEAHVGVAFQPMSARRDRRR